MVHATEYDKQFLTIKKTEIKIRHTKTREESTCIMQGRRTLGNRMSKEAPKDQNW